MISTASNEKNITYDAVASVKKWGNSQGIRLSKELMNKTGFKENDDVGISIDNGKLIIEKICRPKYLDLKDRLEAFYNCPIENIYVDETSETETGDAVGNEIW